MIYMIITQGFTTLTDILIGISLYIDPNMFYFSLSLRYLDRYLRKQEQNVTYLFKSLFIWIIMFSILILIGGDY